MVMQIKLIVVVVAIREERGMDIFWKYTMLQSFVLSHYGSCCDSAIVTIQFYTELDSPKGEFTGLLLLTLDRNFVMYENEKFAKTDRQLSIDPDPYGPH